MCAEGVIINQDFAYTAAELIETGSPIVVLLLVGGLLIASSLALIALGKNGKQLVTMQQVNTIQ